jgi:hypothetical protein
LPITVTGKSGSFHGPILLDTGSDDIVFPDHIALQIGLDLSRAPQRQAVGVGGSAPTLLRYGPVQLELSDSRQKCRWNATVAFAKSPMRIAIFGIAGGLEYFITRIDFAQMDIEMIPQSGLPKVP